MKKIEIELQSVEKIDSIVCNACGREIEHTIYGFNCVELNASFGYDSNKDCEDHSSDICEDCYDKIVSTFKIPPTINRRA